jgi:hypothetical protein
VISLACGPSGATDDGDASGSICFAPGGAAEGTCTTLCKREGDVCPSDCVACGLPGLGLCLPECAAMGCDPGAPCAPPG